MLHVEIKQVKHGLHNGLAVVLAPLRCKPLDPVQMLAAHASRQLDHGHHHGECSSLYWDERLVHVDAHGVRRGVELLASLFAQYSAHHLDQQFLRIASAKIEANCFKYESFQSDYYPSWRLKDLEAVSDLMGSRSTKSGVDCTLSSGALGFSGFLTLYAAARMSFDFLIVSSTLHATNSDASAASW